MIARPKLNHSSIPYLEKVELSDLQLQSKTGLTNEFTDEFIFDFDG